MLYDLEAQKHAITYVGHNKPVRDLCFTPDGKFLISGECKVDITYREKERESEREKERFELAYFPFFLSDGGGGGGVCLIFLFFVFVFVFLLLTYTCIYLCFGLLVLLSHEHT